MKKLVAVLIMLIFILPVSMAQADRDKGKRHKKYEKEYYHSYERHPGEHRGHSHSRYYKKYKHDRRHYKRERYFRNWHEWEHHRERNNDRYRHGDYDRDEDDRLTFSYCLENSERSRRESSRQEACFSISIGD